MKLNTRKTNNPIKKRPEYLNRHFSKDIQKADKHEKMFNITHFLEKCRSKLQWGIIVPARCIITPARMVMINECWRRCREKGSLLHCWQKCKLMKPLWRTIWRLLNKLGIKLPYDPEFPLLSIYTWEDHNSKRHMYPKVHCSTIYRIQDMEAM